MLYQVSILGAFAVKLPLLAALQSRAEVDQIGTFYVHLFQQKPGQDQRTLLHNCPMLLSTFLIRR